MSDHEQKGHERGCIGRSSWELFVSIFFAWRQPGEIRHGLVAKVAAA